MAIVRCPHCNLPLTEAEALALTCPACANPLVDEAASPPADVVVAEPPPPIKRGLRFERVLLAAAVIVIAVLSASLVAVLRTESSREELAVLRARAQAAEQQIGAAEEQAKQVFADSANAQGKLAAAEKTAADALIQIQNLEQQVAAAMERAQNLEQEKKEILAQVTGQPSFKNLLLPRDIGKRFDAKIRIVADGVLRTINIDKPDGEYRLPTLNNGAQVKLSGRVKTLRVDHISGGTLDASELVAGDIIFIGGINNSAKVKVNAQSSVTVPFIDTRSEVDIASPGGKVQVGWINGSAQVSVVAREFTLRDYLDGKDTKVTATLTAAGRFQFREIRGKTHFLWKKALETDPEVEYQQGIIRAPAEFRQIVPNG
jgi:multidrug efflux pump subunit AcrA (membrane-fusion protein)